MAARASQPDARSLRGESDLRTDTSGGSHQAHGYPLINAAECHLHCDRSSLGQSRGVESVKITEAAKHYIGAAVASVQPQRGTKIGNESAMGDGPASGRLHAQCTEQAGSTHVAKQTDQDDLGAAASWQTAVDIPAGCRCRLQVGRGTVDGRCPFGEEAPLGFALHRLPAISACHYGRCLSRRNRFGLAWWSERAVLQELRHLLRDGRHGGQSAVATAAHGQRDAGRGSAARRQ